MLQSSFLLLSILFVFRPCHADIPQENFNLQFGSSRITFLQEDSPYLQGPSGRYSPVLRFLFEKVLAWVPTGKGALMSQDCQTEKWAERMQDPRIRESAVLQGALIQKYFKDCRAELQTGATSVFANATRMMTMKLMPTSHPFLHPVLFHMPGNIKLKGLLGLKGDYKKRPMIVLRVGVFSNVAEFFPERAWLMMLFEQTPFNVLLIENMSGSDFIANNSKFAFGGYDEGLQNILVAQILQDPNEPLHKLIDSLHLFGVSLGGHGVLFASLLNELNSPPGKPLYQSFIGMCPVVDLKASMHDLTLHAPFSYAVDLWSRKRLAGLREKWPSLDSHPSFSFLETAVSEVVRTYHGGLSYVSSVKLPEKMQDGAPFWELNNFWQSYKDVKRPVLIMSTQQDPIVPFDENSKRLQMKDVKLGRSNLSVVDFPEGVHCTLPVAYDWKALSSLFRAYFLSHSPGFHLKNQELKVDLEDPVADQRPGQNARAQFDIAPMEETDKFVKILVHIKKDADQTQDLNLNLNLPLSQFDFRFLNETLSPSEQWMIQRWVQQNVSMVISHVHGKSQLIASWPLAQ